jgi:hypothetical protein
MATKFGLYAVLNEKLRCIEVFHSEQNGFNGKKTIKKLVKEVKTSALEFRIVD